MSDTFKAIVIDKADDEQAVSFRDLSDGDLMEGTVTVAVEYSTVNYKDGLALTGKAPVVRRFPLVPGIDFAGTVIASSDPDFKPDDTVVLNGWGMGENHHGGFAGRARVPGAWLVRLPEKLSTRQAMAIGTAGYTAMLCIMALEDHGVTPDAGDVLVTGAAGGVGSVAVAVLANLGYRVVASTGRPEEEAFLKGLGASEVIDRGPFSDKPRPLAKSRWAGAIDVAGSVTLANVLSQMEYGGVVAACGLAQGMDLPTSVAPFILRGVTLAGIDSVQCPQPRREAAWERLARDLDLNRLEVLTSEIALDDVPRVGGEIVEGKIRGRVVVKIR